MRLTVVALISALVVVFAASIASSQQPATQFDQVDMEHPIYFERLGAIYKVMIDGTGLEMVTEGARPSISPDRSRLAYYNQGFICLYNLADKESSQLVEFEPASLIEWGIDGKWILFAMRSEKGPLRYMQVTIFTGRKSEVDAELLTEQTKKPLSRTGRSQYTRFDDESVQSLNVLSGPGRGKTLVRASDIAALGDCEMCDFKGYDPYFALEERAIIFRAKCGAAESCRGPIYYVSRGGQGLKRLTHMSFDAMQIAVSPSGRWLVFQDADRVGGAMRIYRFDLEQPAVDPVAITDGSNPTW